MAFSSPDQVASIRLTGVRVVEGTGDSSGRATGVQPGALSALLQEVAAAPEMREAEPPSLPPGTAIGRFEILRELGRSSPELCVNRTSREAPRLLTQPS